MKGLKRIDVSIIDRSILRIHSIGIYTSVNKDEV